MGETKAQDLESLWGQARVLLREGRLPRDRAIRTWGGTGTGATCAVCGAAITASEPELEIEVPRVSAPLRFHRQCHAVWDAVRAEIAAGWVCVSERLPAEGTPVEARIQLGGGRIILTVVCRQDPQLATLEWINATTGAPLPAGWEPAQWRAVQTDAPSEEAPSQEASSSARSA